MFHQIRAWSNRIFREAWLVTREAAGEAIGKSVKIAGERTAEVIFKEARAELLADIMALPAEDTKNLWRRHREATLALRENRFVSLLTKIKDQRQDILAGLNRLTDEEFEQVLYLLEHDPIPQAIDRLRDNVKDNVKQRWPKVKRKGEVTLRRADNLLADGLYALDEWLEDKGVR